MRNARRHSTRSASSAGGLSGSEGTTSPSFGKQLRQNHGSRPARRKALESRSPQQVSVAWNHVAQP